MVQNFTPVLQKLDYPSLIFHDIDQQFDFFSHEVNEENFIKIFSTKFLFP